MKETAQKQKYYCGYIPLGNEPSLSKRERLSKQYLKKFHKKKTSKFLAFISNSFDWRNHNGDNYLSPIKNQGACNSCVAFAAVAVVESMLKIANGPAINIILSEAQLFYCVGRTQNATCFSGWSMEPSQIAFHNIGVPDNACYPYTDIDQNCSNLCADWQNRVVKTSGYVILHGPDEIKSHIVNRGPVQTAFTMYTDFYNNYGNIKGIYHLDPAARALRAHCVCIVGFDDLGEYWICKNSWGDWGENGFFRIGYGECGIDAYAFGPNGLL